MTKTILSIAGALALTAPFFATKEQPLSPIETNNQLKYPLENTVIAGSYSSSYTPGVCTRDGLPRQVFVAEYVDGDFPVPVHCKEPNCGLGVYARHEGSNEEHCSACGASKPVNL